MYNIMFDVNVCISYQKCPFFGFINIIDQNRKKKVINVKTVIVTQ